MSCSVSDTVLCIAFWSCPSRGRKENTKQIKMLLFGFYLGFFSGVRKMDLKFYLTFIVEEKTGRKYAVQLLGQEAEKRGLKEMCTVRSV